ncbi:MAG TPA: PC4/YdbC family ssDNA-binding protein [Clostridia bacterium]|nr:PC4/YdbC family ssDNA-binding protein [Clostridia bacterium]
MAEFKFEIKKEIAVLSSSPKSGWNRELNFVSWNGNAPKLDIRDWSPDHTKMGKGITLSHEETAILMTILNDLSLDELFGLG